MAITIRLLTVTDIHRQEVLYQELVEAVRIHRPHVVACVGDFLHGGMDNVGRLRPAQAGSESGAIVTTGTPSQKSC